MAGIADTVTDGVTDILVLRHTLTAGNDPAAGIGVGISVGIQDAGGLAEQGSMDWVLNNVVDGSEVSQFKLAVATGGTNTNVLTATGTQVAVLPTTDSTSTTTGAMTVAGGNTTDTTDGVNISVGAVGAVGAAGAAGAT